MSPGFTDEAILVRVLHLTSEVLSVDDSQVSEDTEIREQLHADSLDLITLVWALEEEFGGKLGDTDLENLSTPRKIADYILSRKLAREP